MKIWIDEVFKKLFYKLKKKHRTIESLSSFLLIWSPCPLTRPLTQSHGSTFIIFKTFNFIQFKKIKSHHLQTSRIRIVVVISWYTSRSSKKIYKMKLIETNNLVSYILYPNITFVISYKQSISENTLARFLQHKESVPRNIPLSKIIFPSKINFQVKTMPLSKPSVSTTVIDFKTKI